MTRKITKAEKEAFSSIGRIGGLASAKSKTKEQRSELGKRAAKIRWDMIKKKSKVINS